MPSNFLFGLGTSNSRLPLDPGAYTMYSKSREFEKVIENGLGGEQGEGTHPFLYWSLKDGLFGGIFFPNPAPSQFEIIKYDGYD